MTVQTDTIQSRRTPLLALLFSPRGRISRSEYWLRGVLTCAAIGILLFVLAATAQILLAAAYAPYPVLLLPLLICVLLWLPLLWAHFAITAKRLHDRNLSALWLLTGLIPVIGLGFGVWLAVQMAFMAGKAGPNRFGADPLEQSRATGIWPVNAVAWRIAALVIALPLSQIANPLSLAFLTPAQWQYHSQLPIASMVLNDRKIPLFRADFAQADHDWRLLSRLMIPQQVGSQIMPIPATYVLGPTTAAEIERHPELYALLKKEAAATSIAVSAEDVRQALDGLGLTGTDTASADNRAEIEQALTGLLKVRAAAAQAREQAAKTAESERSRQLQQECQTARLSLVEFDAADYRGDAQPTPEQLDAQFLRYRDQYAGNGNNPAGNPLGFGYRFPDRVKFEALCVPADEVRKAALAKESPNRWRVEAMRYYLHHPEQFQTGPQVPATSPSEIPGGSTTPTTRPFAEVSDAIQARLVEAEASRMQAIICNRIASIILSDYTSQRGQPADAAPVATSLGIPYIDPQYLRQLASTIQREFRVLPTVISAGEFRSADELRNLPGIGKACLSSPPTTDFPMLATTVDVFTLTKDQATQRRLSVWQPSSVLGDEAGNRYLFRITSAEPAHNPEKRDSVDSMVRSDWHRLQAYNWAKDAAGRFLASLRGQSIEAAARDLGKAPIQTGFVSNDPDAQVAQYAISAPAMATFIEQVFRLAGADARQTSATRPTGLIEVPQQNKVLVARIEETRPEPDEHVRLARQQRIESRFTQSFLQSYFNYDSVISRLKYMDMRPTSPPSPQPTHSL